jgi:hypothetical protein
MAVGSQDGANRLVIHVDAKFMVCVFVSGRHNKIGGTCVSHAQKEV